MKRCPQCRRDYYDDSLFYCLDDGSPLLEGPATAVFRAPDISAESPTKLQIPLDGRGNADTETFPTDFRADIQNGDGQLIGRLKEIAEIRELLANDDIRLVTLTGIGGTGKSRLARELLRLAKDQFSDGVFWVELASISDPMLVAPTVARSMGVKETDSRAVFDALDDHLRGRSVLLVLDNFEQVIAAVVQLSELLGRSAGLKMLVTSRESLKLTAEREYQVPPLALPLLGGKEPCSDLMGFEGVQLFVERAKRARPDFELTPDNCDALVSICHKLDGLPLALELAAARTKVLSVSEILAKLEDGLALLSGGARDLPHRQQTMRAAIEWSFALLNDDEKNVFSRLSAFEGGFSFGVAETVISPGAAHVDILDTITSLSEKSLVLSERLSGGELRFRMLGVVREYARETLEISGEAETMSRVHAEYFLALAEEAAPHLRADKSAEWLSRLETEHDNLRAAIRWTMLNEPEMAARIVASVRHLWTIHGHIREGQHWMEEVLEKSPELPSHLRWELLTGLGNMAQFRGDLEYALSVYMESLAISRISNDQKQISQSLRGIGAIEYMGSNFASARERISEALAISRSLKDEFGAAASRSRLGDIAFAEGNIAEGRLRMSEALEDFRRLGYKQGIAAKLGNLGTAELLDGDPGSARRHLEECLNTCLEIGDEINIRLALLGFAALMAEGGDFQSAARLSGVADTLAEEIEFVLEPAERRFHDLYFEKLQTEMGEKEFADAYAEGVNIPVEEATKFALEYDY